MTNLRDCQSGHGTTYLFQKFIPVKTLAILLISTIMLYLFGLLPIPRWFVIGAISVAVVIQGLLNGFLLMVPYMNCILMRDGAIVEQPFSTVNLTQRMTQEAVDFLER